MLGDRAIFHKIFTTLRHLEFLEFIIIDFPLIFFIFMTELLQQRLSRTLSKIDILQREFCRQIMYQKRTTPDESSLVDLNRVYREIFANPGYVLYMISYFFLDERQNINVLKYCLKIDKLKLKKR